MTTGGRPRIGFDGTEFRRPPSPPVRTASYVQPVAQRIYVHKTAGYICQFDSWISYPNVGYYRLSTRKFLKLNPANMRVATEAERLFFDRARRNGIEAVARQPG